MLDQGKFTGIIGVGCYDSIAKKIAPLVKIPLEKIP